MSDVIARLERIPMSRPHYRLLLMGGLGLAFDGLDVAALAFVLPSVGALWDLSTAQVGLLGSSTLIGFLFGALSAGIAGDRIGRRRVMMWALALYCAATVVSALSPNEMVFFGARVVAGFGTGAESAIIPAFLSEFVPGRLRGRFIGALAGFFSFGYVSAALLGRFVVPMHSEGWRLLLLITAMPVVMLLWWRRRVPESPRFLLATGDTAAAERVVTDMEDAARRSTRRELPEIVGSAVSASDPQQQLSTMAGLKALWSKELAGRTAVLWLLWLVITFAFYGFFTFIPTLLHAEGLTIAKSFTYAVVIYLAQIPGFYSAAALNDLLDRKWTIACYLAGGAVSAYLLANAGASAWVMLYGGLLSFFMNGVYASMYAYTPEVYPTVIRARGMGAASSFGRIGGISAPLIIGALYPVIGFNGVFVMTTVALLLGAAAVLIFGVSTKGRTLEEISESPLAKDEAPAQG